MTQPFDPYRIWLGIPPGDQPPNHYRLLGVSLFESDREVIANASDRQMGHVRKFQSGPQAALSQKVMAELALARLTLLDPSRKAAYDHQLQTQMAAAGAVPPPAYTADAGRTPHAPPPVLFLHEATPPAIDDEAAPRDRPAWQGLVATAAAVTMGLLLLAWLLVPQGAQPPVVADAKVPQSSGGPTAHGMLPRDQTPLSSGQPPASEKPAEPPGGSAVHSSQTPSSVEETPSIRWKLPAGRPATASASAGSAAPAAVIAAGDSQQAVQVSPPTTVSRSPVPSPDALRQAEQQIKTRTFKDAFAQADTPAKKAALAFQLVDESRRPSQDDVTAYGLLRIAGELAGEVGDAVAALDAVEEVARRFEVDLLPQKAAVLEVLAAVENPWTEPRGLLQKIQETVEEAIRAEDFATAERLVELARPLSTKLRDGVMIRRVDELAGTVRQCREMLGSVEQARQSLQVDPDNPQANECLGKYLCWWRGDWSEGLANLAKAADPTVKRLARSDLAGPDDPQHQLALADGWWILARQQTGRAQEQMRRHAAQWYQAALPDLSGEDKSQASQRIEEAGGPSALSSDPEALAKIRGFECRQEPARSALLAKMGGTQASQAAVEKAVRWLAEHQFRDGNWNFDHRVPHLKGPFQDPGTLAGAPNAATALAVLAMLGAGQGQRDAEFRTALYAGVHFLIKRMAPFGRDIGTFHESVADQIPSHAWTTMALSEAGAIGKDRDAVAAAQAGLNYIALTQNADGGWARRPSLPDQKKRPSSDTVASMWNLAALTTAGFAGLQLPRGTVARAQGFLDSVQTRDGTGYRSAPTSGHPSPDATVMGFLGRSWFGWQRTRPELQRYLEQVGRAGPALSGDFHLNYHAALLLRTHGGDAWESWNPRLRDFLVAQQEKSGPESGSWHLRGQDPMLGPGGRLYSTAMAALILEVYYRYPPRSS